MGIERVNACDTLVARFERMQREGLKSINVSFSNTDDTTRNMLCFAVEDMLRALEAGECTQLEFGDSRR